MLQRLLIKKSVNEALLLFLACGLMLFSFCWARVWITCQFELDKFAPLLKQFKAFERFAPVPLEQLLTYTGSIAMTFNEPVLILCIVVWCISRGSDVVSGEIGRGTMEMLLAQPITRFRLLATHAGVTTVGLALLCFLVWLGIYCGIHTNTVKETIAPSIDLKLPFIPVEVPIPVGESKVVQRNLADKVSASLFVAPAINLFAFGFFLQSLSSLFSCCDRYRWRAIGVVIGIYVVELLMFLLSRATDWTQFVGYFSFFSLYQPDGIVQVVNRHPEAASEFVSSFEVPGWSYYLGPMGMSALLVSFGIVFYLVGLARLSRRDMPAPI